VEMGMEVEIEIEMESFRPTETGIIIIGTGIRELSSDN